MTPKIYAKKLLALIEREINIAHDESLHNRLHVLRQLRKSVTLSNTLINIADSEAYTPENSNKIYEQACKILLFVGDIVLYGIHKELEIEH